jgi:hypothetical protein
MNNTIVSTDTTKYRLPTDKTLKYISKLSISEDKPIMFDYWESSLNKTAVIGVGSDDDKMLVKGPDEYTSTIVTFYETDTEYIVITANSIYVIDSSIPTKRISSE